MVVEAFALADRALVASRGYNMATALEIALKLKETGAVFAEGYSTADLLHGPIALAGAGIPLLAIRPDGPMGPGIDEGVARAEAAGSAAWVVGGAGGRRTGHRGRNGAVLGCRSISPRSSRHRRSSCPASSWRRQWHALVAGPGRAEGLTKVTMTR